MDKGFISNYRARAKTLQEYRDIEQSLRMLEGRLERMKNSEELKREMEFEGKLTALLEEYGLSLTDIVRMLDVKGDRKAAGKPRRKKRAVSFYKNPYTGETVEAPSPSHLVLKAWRKQYGPETVRRWKVPQDSGDVTPA